ncbi:HPP family protein [Corynebacterium sp. CCUG 65737]|nr:HPP family protein [Corynebacterium sp. CCUG 65737]
MPLPLIGDTMFTTAAPPRPPIRTIAVSTLSSCAALGVLAALTAASGHPWLIPPMAASMALIMGVPHLPLAQPRNVVGGQTLSALVGVLVGLFGDSLWLGALAGGLALGAMMAARMPHSPAAATAVLGVSVDTNVGFVALALLAAVVLAVVGLAGNRLNGAEYPSYFW